jgi:excisionase family DNA binding protein
MAVAIQSKERLLIKAQEAAELLAISPRTLHELTKAGKVPCIKLGRRGVRYSPAALKIWIENHVTGDWP